MSPALIHRQFFPVLALLSLAPAFVAEAAPWKKEPQPLVAGSPKTGPRYAVTATPGSNLVFDSSWRILWSVDGGSLTGHIWNRAKYFERLAIYAPTLEMFRVRSGSALVLDPAWHVTYFVSPEGRLRAMQKSSSGWVITETIPESVTQVLGVHPDWHTVFAYDAASRSLLAVHWSAAENMWKSEVIATDLGDAPCEGVVDPKRHVLYATFQNAPGLGVPAASGRLQPWPMVAVWWDGARWSSQAIAATGVAQRPAHVPAEDRLYYTDRADLTNLRSFRPSQGALIAGQRKFIPDLLTKGTHGGSTAPVFRSHAGWQGAATWVDDQGYAVDLGVQSYFPGSNPGWSGLVLSSSATWDGWGSHSFTGSFVINDIGNALIWLNGGGGQVIPPKPYEPPPHIAVSAHVPVWETPEHAGPGLQQFRALYSQKRREIVQQRLTEGEWTQTVAHSWQTVDRVYQVPGENLYYRLGPGVVTSRRRHYELTAVSQAAGNAGVLSAVNSNVNVQSGFSALNNNISGSGGLVKNGSGTLMFGGVATHTGGTTVSAGRLMLTGATIQSTVNVSHGATLSGNGSVSGAVTVGGTLAPGDSIGTLSTGALTLSGGSSLSIDVGDWNGTAGIGYDTVHAASLNLAGSSASPINLNVNGLGSAGNFNSDLVLLSTTDGITGYFPGAFTLPSGSEGWSVVESGNDLVLRYSGQTAAPPSNGSASPSAGQGTENSGTQVVTPMNSSIPALLPGQTYAWSEVVPGNPPVITVDGVSYFDPTHAETVTSVPSELRKSLTDLLGKGAVIADPATLPSEVVDLVETGAGMHTFGHRIADANPRSAAPGGRVQSYSSNTMASARAGGIACDAAGSMVFYVQAPAPGGGPCWIVVVN